MRRMMILGLVLALLAAACGDSDSGDDTVVSGADLGGEFIDSGTEDQCEPTGQVTDRLNDATYAIVLRWVSGQDADGDLTYSDFLIGTGWAVGNRRIMTNAHVAEVPFQYPDAQLVAVQAGTGEVVNLLTAYVHPSYTRLDEFTPDVGMFTSQQELPVTLPLAPEETSALEVRGEILITGFPGDVDDVFPITVGETRPQATALTGRVSALRTYDDTEAVELANVDTIQHDMSTSAGNSGSALVVCGQVVGIHNAGLYLSVYTPSGSGPVVDRVPSSNNRFGHHVRYIHELLELEADDVIEGASVGGEGLGTFECPSTASMLETANAATYAVVVEIPIIDANGQQRLQYFTLGTAFAIGERLMATNAHVSSYFDNPDTAISNVFGVQSGTGAVVALTRSFTHPDYDQDVLRSPDVGLFTTIESLPVTLELADPASVDLQLGEDVFIVGFPGDVDDFIPVIPGQTIPQATSLTGSVTALRGHNDADQVDAANVDVIQHQAPTTPGTSGSPMLACGQVVGTNNAGTSKFILEYDPGIGDVVIDRIPAAANGFGVHVRWIDEAVRLFEAQALDGTALPPEAPAPVAAAPATAQVAIQNCPTEVPAGVDTFCQVISANVTGGQWELPGFTDNPIGLETINGVNEVRFNPNSSAIGQSFTLTAVVTGADGTQAVASHTFTVVG